MQRIWGLFKKEIRTYFNSPIAYLLITILLIGIGYFFFQTFFVANQASLRVFFRFAAWSFLLFGPAITMKLFAEEKKSGTIETLLTLPIKEWEVVLGKFFAGWALLAVYLLITLAYPISISFIGDLDPGPVIGGYFGLFLLGGTFVALGLFTSALTRNQVVSLVLAFFIGLILFLLDMLLPFVPVSLQNLFEFVGVDSHFKNVARGVIDSRDLIYSLSLMVIFLFGGVQALQARLSDHSRIWRLNKILYVSAAIGCFVSLNVFSYQVSGRLDLTEDQMYTLSDASRELVSELDDQLTIKAYFSANLPAPFNNHQRFLRDLLEEYRNTSGGHLSFEFVDPGAPGAEGQPDADLAAEVKAAQIPKVEVSKLEKDQVQMVKVFMGLAMRYQDNMETIPVLQNIDNLEFEITSRIAKLIRERTPQLAFLGGHGELISQQGLSKITQLLQQKFNVGDVHLADGPDSLAEVDVLVVAGPKKEIPAEHRFYIDQFIMEGGKVAFLLDRNEVNPQTFIGRPLEVGIEDMLEHYGVRVEPAMVLDQVNQRVALTRAQGNVRFQSYVAFPPFVRVKDFDKDSPLVKNLRDLPLPFVSPLTVLQKEGVRATVLARSSPKTWLFENEDSFLVDPQALPMPEEDDFVGPQDLVVTMAGSFDSYYKDQRLPNKEDSGAPVAESLFEQSPATRLVVTGSSLWISDAVPSRLSYLFFANLVDWLSEDERLIGIRARAITNRPLEVDNTAAKSLVKYGNMFALPLLFVVFGIVRWRLRSRRKRKAQW